MKINFNRIYIIESLQPGERQTGTELHNDLLRWESLQHPDFESILINPVTHDDFLNLLDEIYGKCTNDGIAPILHFEIHGAADQSGLVLTSHELVRWEELSDKLRPINHFLKNGLFITMGVCHGCYFMSTDVISKPSIFQGIVASFDKLYNGDIYIQFYAFYEELFSSFDLNSAYSKLIDANPDISDPNKKINYALYSSEYIFAMVYTDYDEKQCTEKAFEQRALSEIAAGNLKFVSRQDKRKKIRDFVKAGVKTRDKYFKETFNTYFMLDDYPELIKDISYPCNLTSMKRWFKNL